MSAPQIPEEAVEAGARGAFDVRDDPYDDDEWEDLDSTDRELYECQSRAVQSAAYPHLRRDWLEGLIAKAEEEYEAADDCWRKADLGSEEEMVSGIASDYAETVIGWLRAELAEGGDGE